MASSDDKLEFEGIVAAECGNGLFSIEVQGLKDKARISATLSGKIRKNNIKILCGDKVKVEVSVYDPTKGRITYRIK
jgi:translation initiation factor IF-1